MPTPMPALPPRSAYDRATNSGGGNASRSAGAERICSGEAKGVTNFAIQKIAQQVGRIRSSRTCSMR